MVFIHNSNISYDFLHLNFDVVIQDDGWVGGWNKYITISFALASQATNNNIHYTNYIDIASKAITYRIT